MFKEGPPPGNKSHEPVANPFARTSEYADEQDYGAHEKAMRAEFERTMGPMFDASPKSQQQKEDAFLRWRRQKAEKNLKKATQSS